MREERSQNVVQRIAPLIDPAVSSAAKKQSRDCPEGHMVAGY